MVLLFTLATMVSFAQVVEKQTTYVLKMSEQEYNEFLNSKNTKTRTTPLRGRRYAHQIDNEGSFGAMGGATTMIGESGSFINFSGGGWVEYKHIGIEYIVSASVTDDLTADNYQVGKVGKWVAGGSSKSYGVFYRQSNGLYYGGGIQTSLIMGLENVSISSGGQIINGVRYPLYTNIVEKPINDKKTLPYITIGYMKNLGEWFTFKGGVIISKFTSLNVGVGYSF